MTLRIYVAGGSLEIERARGFIAAAREIEGVDVTHDWTAEIDALGPDSGLSAEQLAAAARGDLEGIRTADAVVFLVPATTSKGMQSELGIALALDKATIGVRSMYGGAGIFGALVGHWCASDGEVLAWLRGVCWARELSA